jgi:predicted methyltransferase
MNEQRDENNILRKNGTIEASEIFEALKPGGILSVTEVVFDPHFQGRSSVRELAAAVGFKE